MNRNVRLKQRLIESVRVCHQDAQISICSIWILCWHSQLKILNNLFYRQLNVSLNDKIISILIRNKSKKKNQTLFKWNRIKKMPHTRLILSVSKRFWLADCSNWSKCVDFLYSFSQNVRKTDKGSGRRKERWHDCN